MPDAAPACLNCTKPKGRIYRCPVCGFVGHRHGLGSANILSQHYTGEPDHVWPAQEKYRHPVVLGKRSRLDTADSGFWANGEARAIPRSCGVLAPTECHLCHPKPHFDRRSSKRLFRGRPLIRPLRRIFGVRTPGIEVEKAYRLLGIVFGSTRPDLPGAGKN